MPTERPHILVVDDAPGVCALVEAALEDAGMRVSSATTAARARQILSADPVDLAIVDIVLNGESGLATARQAMAMGARVLLMSGFADVDEAEMPFPFIAKPFAIRDLVDTVSFLANAEAIS
jgi:DNA-binding NtrC family response regulator